MSILHGFGQLLLFLVGNALVLLGLMFLARRLRRIIPKSQTAVVDQVPTRSMTADAARDSSLPDFSPALLHMMVRGTPKPKPRSVQGTSTSMFFVLLPSMCMSLVPAPAHGQSANPTITLPPLHVDALSNSCVDVEVEGTRQPAFDCLNGRLKAAAEGTTPSDPNTALNAVVGNAEPNKVGTFSHTGESIRMGNNFGKSAFPQRPAAPAYGNGLTAGVK